MIDPFPKLIHRSAGRHGPIAHVVSRRHTRRRHTRRRHAGLAVAASMQQFREQLDFLGAEGYATPTMGELISAPAREWAGQAAVITFDDGYVDNLAACEELHPGMRASWFSACGSVGKSPQWPADGRPAQRLLNANELREMRQNGMEIGSHTVNHVRLTEVDDARLAQELADSRNALEDMLGNAVKSFAYPYGAWDARCAEAVKQAGYTGVCTTRTGWTLHDRDPYRLRRLTVFNHDNLGRFARKLCFGSHDVGWRNIAAYAFRRMQKV